MFDTTFFRDDLVIVIHEKHKRINKNLLEDSRAVFVWGELMDPHFIHGLLGHFLPFAPAYLKGFRRHRTKEFFNITKKAGGVVQGVVLLGLSKDDERKLNDFEQEGVAMRRTSGMVSMGHFTRRTAMYVKI